MLSKMDTLKVALGDSTLGRILVASSDKGIRAVLLGDDDEALRQDLQDRFPRSELVEADAELRDLFTEIADFLNFPNRDFERPLDMQGTDFQRKVWEDLRRIQPGSTVSYAEIARRIGRPEATRAVAGACAANPLAILVPCHRVLTKEGKLSGYRWGVERKSALLEREGYFAVFTCKGRAL